MGFGVLTLMLAGSSLWNRLRAAFIIPAAPAAPFRWPMLDFTDPSGTLPTGSPNGAKASMAAFASTTSPTRVEVPWPS